MTVAPTEKAPVDSDQGSHGTRSFSGMFNVARKPTGSNHHDHNG
jgi:hypothetical protein